MPNPFLRRAPLLPLILCLSLGLLAACRSPLRDLGLSQGLDAAVAVEDHSRTLKRLREVAPGEADTPEARKGALETHRAYLDAAFRARAAGRGLPLDPASPWILELRISTLGEVRTRHIVYGILSGVAWGVGMGLATHNVRLAVGLGGYELVEESVFWIAGSSLFGRYSAPVVLEAQVREKGRKKPLWSESYCVVRGGARLRDRPEARRGDRSVQLASSLDRALDKLFEDLSALPALASRTPAALSPAPGGLRSKPTGGDAGT